MSLRFRSLNPTITKAFTSKPISIRNHSTMSPSRPHSSHHKATSSNSHPKFGSLSLSTSGPQDCALNGTALLSTPYFNKGAGFTAEERDQFKLTGLLPQHVATLDAQVKRAYQQYSTRQDDLAKNTFMTSLAEQNQVLYYRVSVLFWKKGNVKWDSMRGSKP
jgi:malate dehydrogenase (oxaloacetate-decarboxylating)